MNGLVDVQVQHPGDLVDDSGGVPEEFDNAWLPCLQDCFDCVAVHIPFVILVLVCPCLSFVGGWWAVVGVFETKRVCELEKERKRRERRRLFINLCFTSPQRGVSL